MSAPETARDIISAHERVPRMRLATCACGWEEPIRGRNVTVMHAAHLLDALAEVEDLLKVDHQCAAVDEAWARDRAERDELRATIERVRELAEDADRRVNASWVHTAEIRRAHTSAYIAYLNQITDHIRECIEADGGDQ